MGEHPGLREITAHQRRPWPVPPKARQQGVCVRAPASLSRPGRRRGPCEHQSEGQGRRVVTTESAPESCVRMRDRSRQKQVPETRLSPRGEPSPALPAGAPLTSSIRSPSPPPAFPGPAACSLALRPRHEPQPQPWGCPDGGLSAQPLAAPPHPQPGPTPGPRVRASRGSRQDEERKPSPRPSSFPPRILAWNCLPWTPQPCPRRSTLRFLLPAGPGGEARRVEPHIQLAVSRNNSN